MSIPRLRAKEMNQPIRNNQQNNKREEKVFPKIKLFFSECSKKENSDHCIELLEK